MNVAAVTFAEMTATLEDLHGVAVEGQHPDLSRDEGRILIVNLREGIVRLDRLAGLADNALRRAER